MHIYVQVSQLHKTFIPTHTSSGLFLLPLYRETWISR